MTVVALRDPKTAPALKAWAKRHDLDLSPADPPWEGARYVHPAYDVVPRDPDLDVVFWLEELADDVDELDVDGHDESPFAWRESPDSAWYILRDNDATRVDPYVAGIVDDVDDVDGLGVVPAEDLNIINRHRASMGMAPIDLSAGWSERELREMAQSIRSTGRMQNEGTVRRLLR